jgi:hypothetical protein
VDPLVPAGRARLGIEAWFDTAEETFGGSGGDEGSSGGRTPFALDLRRTSAALLFPGTADLRERLAEALGGDADAFPLRLGASTASARTHRVAVPLSLDVGVFEWLTLGVTVPFERTRIESGLEILPDAGADLGVNPALSNRPLVQTFVESLASGAQQAEALATERCDLDEGSQGCMDALALAEEMGGAAGAFEHLFGASFLFPAAGTATGEALTTRVSDLEARLVAEGLGELADLPLAAQPLEREGMEDLLTDAAGPYGYILPPGTVGGVWGVGDAEARIAVRLLEGVQRDSAGEPTGTAWRLAALGAVRLPTAAGREPDVVLLPRVGDGQLDLVAGAYGALAVSRFAVRSRVLYTRQQPGEVIDRVTPRGVAIATRENLTRLDWDPGDELDVEVQPAFRLAPALSFGLVWRYHRHGQDRYTRLDPLPAPPELPYVPAGTVYDDASVLAAATETSAHEVGGSLTYRTTGLPGSEHSGLEVFAEVRRAVSGSAAPVSTRAAFGGRLLVGLWGR